MIQTISKKELDRIQMTPYLFPMIKQDLIPNTIAEKIIQVVGLYYHDAGILNTVFERLEIPLEEQSYKVVLKSRRRFRELVEMRQTMMYFIKKHTSLSLKSIGKHFGSYDHSTVIHGITEYDNYHNSAQYIKKHTEISERINNQIS